MADPDEDAESRAWEDAESRAWTEWIAQEWATELNDPREDIYTEEDGQPADHSPWEQTGPPSCQSMDSDPGST